MLETRKVITIDGLAATGKSSIAQSLAKKLSYSFFSSGYLYRLLGYAVLSEGGDPANEPSVIEVLKKAKMDIGQKPNFENMAYLNGKDVTNLIFDTRVSEASSKVSVYPEVRARLLDLQRGVFPGKNIIAEGRDMGTVVFPDANLKFFIEVDPAIRIERRMSQSSKGRSLTPEELKSLKQKMEIEITERDKRDIERQISPTIPAKDAIIINNSGQTLTEVIEKMYHFVSKKDLA